MSDLAVAGFPSGMLGVIRAIAAFNSPFRERKASTLIQDAMSCGLSEPDSGTGNDGFLIGPILTN